MNMHSCERHTSATTAGSKRYPLLTLTLGTLLIAALTPAVAQQEVRHTPFEAHAQVHASSSNQAMETTHHAATTAAIPRNNKPAAVPKPKHQPRQSPQAYPGHYTAVSHAPSSTFKPVTHKPPHTYTAKQRSLQAPTGPGPMHAGAANNANSHGIIFVGGHAQPLQPGVKQSLNPQPIPPGHAVRHAPPPGAPIQHVGH